MKWMKWLFVMSLSAGMLSLVGCGDDDSPTAPSTADLIGIWSGAGGDLNFTFNSDGSFEVRSRDGELYDRGTWTLEGSKLTLSSTENGTQDELTVSISKDTLTLKDSEGNKIPYTRQD